VELIDAAGDVLWRYAHPPWGQGSFESGCAWFDEAGRAFAVVPAAGYEGCTVLQLSARDGTPTAQAALPCAPAGIEVIHQTAGWAGLSVGEGQDGAYAWWARAAGSTLELISLDRSDEVLFDASPTAEEVLLTPHDSGPITVRRFPSLEAVRMIAAPDGYDWDFYACFCGELIIARAHAIENEDDEVLLATDAGDHISVLARTERPIIPGPDRSWLLSESSSLERWGMIS
jgi:hypothetical protein